MKIRKAKKEDLNEICNIYIKESSKKPYNEKYTKKTALIEFKELFKKDFFVVLDEEEIIGFVASEINPNEKQKAHICELWFKENYQKKGYGTQLLRFIEDRYKKRGVKKIRLGSKRKSYAFKFYKKRQYKEDNSFVYLEKEIK